MKVAIVGAGVIGLAVARELLLSGQEVEIFDIAPGCGASAGNSRIFRQSHDDPRMVQLSRSNASLWQDWEKGTSGKLIARCGLLYSGAGARRRYELLKENHIPCKWESENSLFRYPALWEEGAGSIYCPQTFSFLLRETSQFIREEFVQEIRPGRLRTISEEIEYDSVVSLAGEGTLQLLPNWSKEIGLEKVPHLRIDFLRKGDLPAIIDHTLGKYGVPGALVYSIGGQEEDPASSNGEILQFADRLKEAIDPRPFGYTLCSSLQITGEGEGWRAKREDGLVSFVGANSYKWAPLHGREIARLVLGKNPDSVWATLGEVKR